MGIFGKEDKKIVKDDASQPVVKSTTDLQGRTIRGSVMSSATLLSNEAKQIQKTTNIDETLQHINEVKFSDIYITPDKTCYIRSGNSSNGLKIAKFIDLDEFIKEVVDKYDGETNSYSLRYKGRSYRIERTIAFEGEQYCARKMPESIPDLERLNLPGGVYNQLLAISKSTGLVLIAGATGMGKSTTIAAVIKKYLQTEGGYAFTIEDPIEMPLDGVYKTVKGDLGLCKQTTPPNGKWEEGIKSALRSKPRYIYLGEIRSPEAAVELLRAATSGHLVFSTIHANNVPDAINALVKYAASSGISEDMAYELMANGFLACIHQTLGGASRRLKIESLFANPNLNAGCQVRAMIRSGKLNLASIMESQQTKLERLQPLF